MKSESNPTLLALDQSARDQFRRLDVWLTERLPALTRKEVKQLFKKSAVAAEGGHYRLRPSRMPNQDMTIVVDLSVLDVKEISDPSEAIDLEILYDDPDIVVFYKPAGIIVHPGPGIKEQTLSSLLCGLYPEMKSVGQQTRPGIVHRLDKGTSGVMLAAKSKKAYEALVETFQQHDLKRIYTGICLNQKDVTQGRVQTLIARDPRRKERMTSRITQGKTATTYYKKLGSTETFALMEFQLETGRTHQIRVHASEQLKMPILGDATYGGQKAMSGPSTKIQLTRPLLHATRLCLKHPITKSLLDVKARPKEDDFRSYLLEFDGASLEI